ncbi:unnamed protein product [Prunus armeniaca]
MQEDLERQERETRKRRRRRAASKRAQRDLDQQLVMVVALLDEENQSRRGSQEGCGLNVNRHRHSQVMHDICNYDEYFVQKKNAARNLGLLPEQKFTVVIRMLAGNSVHQGLPTQTYAQGPITASTKSRNLRISWNDCPNITYEINNIVYHNGYYLADGIYPRWTTFVKSIPHPRSHKQKLFDAYQEGYIKDVERCFGIIQARWAIIRGTARLFDEKVLRSIMMTCIILHNMIVEDEYD